VKALKRALLSIGIGLALISNSAHSQNRIENRELRAQLSASRMVALVEVRAIAASLWTLQDSSITRDSSVSITLRVLEVLKGDRVRTMVVRLELDSAAQETLQSQNFADLIGGKVVVVLYGHMNGTMYVKDERDLIFPEIALSRIRSLLRRR